MTEVRSAHHPASRKDNIFHRSVRTSYFANVQESLLLSESHAILIMGGTGIIVQYKMSPIEGFAFRNIGVLYGIRSICSQSSPMNISVPETLIIT